MKTALITGAKGQDAYYLTKLLLKKNYRVLLTTRKYDQTYFNQFIKSLNKLAIQDENIFIKEVDYLNFNSINVFFDKYNIEEIYNLTGQSNVLFSFKSKKVSAEEPIIIFENFINLISRSENKIKFFQATTSEIFQDIGKEKINEESPVNAISPYAIGKLDIHNKLNEVRQERNLFLVSGIMFNHESPRRSDNYLFGYIAKKIKEIQDGKINSFEISNLETVRDWGYSGDFVDAMWQSLNFSEPDDYIISTGKSYSVEEILDHSFTSLDLNYKDHIIEKYNSNRDYDVLEKYSDPSKINEKLGWKAKFDGKSVIDMMINVNK
tara:strand:+ start:2229 stop:3194 length:966 start_codon:yes stop_codon:yes gene_type:complete